jgi:hypothetical protein
LPLLGFVPVLVQGVALLAHGAVVPLGFELGVAALSLCGVAVPVALLGVALSCALDGVAGVEGVVVVVWVVLLGVVVVVVLLLGVEVVVVLCALFISLELDGVVVVLCASANVPVRSRPAARIDTFFM